MSKLDNMTTDKVGYVVIMMFACASVLSCIAYLYSYTPHCGNAIAGFICATFAAWIFHLFSKYLDRSSQ